MPPSRAPRVLLDNPLRRVVDGTEGRGHSGDLPRGQPALTTVVANLYCMGEGAKEAECGEQGFPGFSKREAHDGKAALCGVAANGRGGDERRGETERDRARERAGDPA